MLMPTNVTPSYEYYGCDRNGLDLDATSESPCGYKETSSRPKSTFALSPASDILGKAGKV